MMKSSNLNTISLDYTHTYNVLKLM